MNDTLFQRDQVCLSIPLILAENTFLSLLSYHYMHVTTLENLEKPPSLENLLGAQWTLFSFPLQNFSMTWNQRREVLFTEHLLHARHFISYLIQSSQHLSSFMPILQVRKPRHREAKELAQSQ